MENQENHAAAMMNTNTNIQVLDSTEKAIESSSGLNRLHFLLERAKLYANFLSEKLDVSNSNNSQNEEKRTSKRKRGDSPEGPMEQPKLVTGGKLREYQMEGVKWLINLYENGLNGILADEMGLGKTIQTISFLAFLWDKGIKGPFMVCAPLSVLENWQNEFTRFAPSIPTVLYHGSPDERSNLRSENFGKGKEVVPVVITSYEMVMQDFNHFKKVGVWKYLVVDEGHRLKNREGKLLKRLQTLQTDNRLLLTGTPLQNNLSELWSLLHFLLPDVFDDLDSFQKWQDKKFLISLR